MDTQRRQSQGDGAGERQPQARLAEDNVGGLGRGEMIRMDLHGDMLHGGEGRENRGVRVGLDWGSAWARRMRALCSWGARGYPARCRGGQEWR